MDDSVAGFEQAGDVPQRDGMSVTDVAVVGGGAIGLSIAYVLAKAGVKATVLDRGELGRGASWAGAGLLPPFRKVVRSGNMIELRSWSALLYEEWSAALLEETGVDNGYRRTGGIDVAVSSSEVQDLKTAAGRWRVEGIAFESLTEVDLGRIEPALRPDLALAYYLPDRAQIRNPRHLRALEASLRSRGVDLRPNQPILGFDRAGDRITAVRTERGVIACGHVVMAAGAWSGGLLAGLGVELPTPPLKGQIVLLRSDRRLLGRIIEHGKNYLVPREDGRILIGATEEEVGFDLRCTPVGIRDLIDQALRLCPILAEAEVERTWAGLRPGSVDTRPYLGRVPGFANLSVATGHKRTGLQLAPGTAEVIADVVLDRPARLDISAFAPMRSIEESEDLGFRS